MRRYIFQDFHVLQTVVSEPEAVETEDDAWLPIIAINLDVFSRDWRWKGFFLS